MLSGTDQEKYRADYLLNSVGLDKYLDCAFFSYEFGVSKSKKEFWYKVLDNLGNPKPENVKFWDDEQENVDAALSVGIKANLFKGHSDLDQIS